MWTKHFQLLCFFVFFSAVQRPLSRSWTLSRSTFPPRSLSATCQAKPRRDSTAPRATGPKPARQLAWLPPTPSWLSSITTWSCCPASAAGRRRWWRLPRACRPTSSPGPRVYSGRCRTSWRNTLWRFCLAQFLPLTPTIWTMTTCRRLSRPRCSLGSGVYEGRKNISHATKGTPVFPEAPE